jgi:DNA-binding Lrp family transcriptional regulator/fido (protein-threonine AMPylation protein)
MAKSSQKQHDSLRQAIAALPSGASLDQLMPIAGALGISRSTLIRRLAELVADGSVTKTGDSRAARYALAVDPLAAVQPQASLAQVIIPLSPAGAEIQTLVSRPIHQRTPAGYDRDFLDGYRPNVTAYLTAAEREILARFGRTSAPDQPAGTHAQDVLNRLLIDLSWNSSRLEGNTYSLLDTERLIELGELAEGKDAADAQMILNHKSAIEFLVQSAAEISFDRSTILNLHALLAENLLGDPEAPGRLRRNPVGIAGSVYHPLSIPQQIAEYFDQILATATAIRDPFEQAFFVMVQIPYLQPFDDVNKRVSRLAANIPLIRCNLSPLSFVDVPKDLYTQAMLAVYELNRTDLHKDVFMWAYQRSAQRYAAVRQTAGEPDPFRLRHRIALKTVVGDVIRARMDKKVAAKFIAKWAGSNVVKDERSRFIEAAETELLALHEGNFARYQVRPSEFQAWHLVWTAKPVAKKIT